MSKRKAITLEEKYKIIKQVEAKDVTQIQIANETGIPRSTIARWCGLEKQKLVDAYEENMQSPARKRLRFSKHEKIDECLFEWFKEKRKMNVPINGPILYTKAEQFAALLGEELKPTNGWLDRWKTRYNISFQQLNGESAKVDETTVTGLKSLTI